jgi:hypothetical protein
MIDYITIASTGNATDFGDLSVGRSFLAACSGAASAVQPTPTSAAMALFGGGSNGVDQTGIQYVNIATTGNAYLFGDLLTAVNSLAACASGTRGLFAGGTGPSNVIQYVTFSSFGKATDFGDMTISRAALTSFSNETRGLFAGGTGYTSVIDYVTIATAGNATFFGNLAWTPDPNTAPQYSASCASSTRGLVGSGNDGYNSNVINYVTIATTGNATDFGDLAIGRVGPGACSSATRGLWGGGYNGGAGGYLNNIDYVTIATTGNAIDFGDLTVARRYFGAASSPTLGVWGGGTTGSASNVIDYVTIASAGNASDFGDLSGGLEGLAACSNAHGGL